MATPTASPTLAPRPRYPWHSWSSTTYSKLNAVVDTLAISLDEDGTLLASLANDVSAHEAAFVGLESDWLLAVVSRYLQGVGSRTSYVRAPNLAVLESGRIVDSYLVNTVPPPHLEAIRWMKDATGLSQERLADLLGVSRQTLNRWHRGEPIKDVNRRRVFAVRDVLERAALRCKTRAQLTAWLDTPRGSDGLTPAALLASGEVDRARLWAITSPSPRLSRAPTWVRRSVAPAFRGGAEREQEYLMPESNGEEHDEGDV